MKEKTDPWNSGDPYEYFMGRWSRKMAPVFVRWLGGAPGLSWLDVGCGTGALGEAICHDSDPRHLYCIDPSAEFLQKARQKESIQADFRQGTASAIPLADHSVDVVVSGLALNFFPDLPAALQEMKRVANDRGTIAAYVWDYAGRMDFLRVFWDAACACDPAACALDEGRRFPICHPDTLAAAFSQAGLTGIETALLDIDTVFFNFDDFWNPFLGGQGPAPGYLAAAGPAIRDQIRASLQEKLDPGPGQPVRLLARAIAVRGAVMKE